MYQIPPKLADYLVMHAKDPQIPGLRKDEEKPYTPKHFESIGVIDPYQVVGTDMDYVIEMQYGVEDGGNQVYTPDVNGCWLYNRRELKTPAQKIKLPRNEIDPYYTGADAMDVTDCCVMTPPPVDKLTAIKVDNLKTLLEKEPHLKECIEEAKKELPWFQRRF